jgi:hypothetical protein
MVVGPKAIVGSQPDAVMVTSSNRDWSAVSFLLTSKQRIRHIANRNSD